MVDDLVVVDTNVVSYNFKKDSRGRLYETHLLGRTPAIAAQTLAELEFMPLVNSWGPARYSALQHELKNYVFLDTTEEVCRQWAKVRAQARRIGRAISYGDSWIAATALAYDLPLITHDPYDFNHIPGLDVITELG
jgi:tRNA(fMet)-specific endonuclease VapC